MRAGHDIVGFTMLYPLGGEGEPAVINLVRFMIDHRFQRRGLGRLAMEAIIRNASSRPGVKVMQLSVLPQNQAAIKLYEALGFKDTGQRVGGEQVFRLRLAAAEA